MNYILNEQGEVLVSDDKGNTKYLPKALAENRFLMKGQELTIVEAPIKFEPEVPESEVKTEDSKKETKSKKS